MMVSEFIMNKKCVKCGVCVKVEKKESNILNRNFKCGLCSMFEVKDIPKCCDTCGFPLIDDELKGNRCKICKIKLEGINNG